MDRSESAQEFGRRNDDEAGLMLDERWQNEYPKICLRLLDLLRLKRPPPRCAQLVLKKYTSVCGVEVLGEFHLQCDGFSISGVSYEQIDSGVLCGQPDAPSSVGLLDFGPD
jgi:hypothetical protein